MTTSKSHKRPRTPTPLDWSSLEHAYGDASDVPELLSALSSPRAATREAALRTLRLSVYHQGWAGYSAAPPLVPRLIRALEDPAVPDKVGILHLLALLSQTHRQAAHGLTERLFAVADWLKQSLDDKEREIVRQTYEEVRKGYPAYKRMLSGPSAIERAAAAYLCALSWEDAAESSSLLFARGTLERDATAAASMMLGVGLCLHRLHEQGAKPNDQAAKQWLTSGLASELPLPRLGAAIALCYLGTPSPEALAVLRQALRSMPGRAQLLWFSGDYATGDLAQGALDVLRALHAPGHFNALPLLCEVLEEKLQALRHLRVEARRRQGGVSPLSLAEACVGMAFPQQGKGTLKWPRGFNAEQRLVVRLLARRPYFMRFERASLLRGMGLQGDDFQRACGVAPATLLSETRWIGARTAKEKTLREWIIAGASSHRLARPLARTLTAREGFSLIEEALADDSDLGDPSALAFLQRLGLALLEAPGASAVLQERARLMLDQGPLARGQEVGGYQAVQLFLWLSAQPQAGVSVEVVEALLLRRAAYWSFTALANFRPAILLLPPERRARVLKKLRGRSSAEPGEPWALYDVFPSAVYATRLLRLMRRWESFFLGAGAAQVILVLAELAKVAAEPLLAAQRDKRRNDRHLIEAAMARAALSRNELSPHGVNLRR
jgi:hypothetical protein